MTAGITINDFGRIGRNVLRRSLGRFPGTVEVERIYLVVTGSGWL